MPWRRLGLVFFWNLPLITLIACAHMSEPQSQAPVANSTVFDEPLLPLRGLAQAPGSAADHWYERVLMMSSVDFGDYCDTDHPENPKTAKNLCLHDIEQDCAACEERHGHCPACEGDHAQFCETRSQNQCATAAWIENAYSKYPWCSAFFIKPPSSPQTPPTKAEKAAAIHQQMPIGQSGHFGPLAQVLITQVAADIKQNGEKSPFMGQYADIQAACPGFEKMNALERVGFYTYVLEILSYNETSCNPRMINNAPDVPNSPAVGLFQLENKSAFRKSRPLSCQTAPPQKNIDPQTGKLTGLISKGSIMDPRVNTKCAVDIMGHLLTRNQALWGEKGKGSYWQSLNPIHTTKTVNGRVVPLTPEELHRLPGSRFKRDLCWYPLCHVDANGRVDKAAAISACSAL